MSLASIELSFHPCNILRELQGRLQGKQKCGLRYVKTAIFFTFVDHVKTNKHMFEFFSPSGSHTILEAIQTRSIAWLLCDSRASCNYQSGHISPQSCVSPVPSRHPFVIYRHIVPTRITKCTKFGQMILRKIIKMPPDVRFYG